MIPSSAVAAGTAPAPIGFDVVAAVGRAVGAIQGDVGAIQGDVGAYTEFLATDPIPSVLLLTGVVITGATVSVLVYLSLGAALEALLSPALR